MLRSSPVGRPLLLALVAPLLIVLSACSDPPTEPPSSEPTVTVHVPEGSALPTPLAATILLADFGAMGTTSTVTEIGENLFVGPVAPLRPDGTVDLVFPDGEDLPLGVLLPAEEAVLNVLDWTGCTLTASDPSVLLTGMMFEGIGLPGVAVLTAEGLYLALATAELVEDISDPSVLYSTRSQTWVYASGPTTVETTPATCEGTAPEVPWLSVDLSLDSGWNLLEWVMTNNELDEVLGISLRESTAEELYLLPAIPFSGT